MRARLPRLGIRRPVRFYRVDELVCAYTDDLNDRGAFVHTDAWLPVNGVVDLCVMLARDAPSVISARVAYCLPPDQARVLGRRSGIGFQFLDLDEPGLPRLRDYVRNVRNVRDMRSARDGRDGRTQDSPSAGLQRRRVLLACPHPRLEKRFAHALSPAGYELSVAPAAQDMLDQLHASNWDAVVLDQSMGLSDRVAELAAAAGAPLPPVLHVATNQDELARLRAYRAGVADCLPRPFTDEELRLRVAQLVRQRRRKPTPDIAGTLRRMPVASVLTLLEHERRSGQLLLDGAAEAVQVSLHDGAICAVDGRLDPGARHLLLSALRWKEGHFEFRSGETHSVSSEPWPISGVLLDGARIEDESRAARR